MPVFTCALCKGARAPFVTTYYQKTQKIIAIKWDNERKGRL